MALNNMLQGDYSSLYSSEPGGTVLGNFQRSWLGELLSGSYQKDIDDWKRQEKSADNALVREALAMQMQNQYADIDRKWQSEEAEKAFERQKELRDTAWISTINQMKEAGINPILAYSQGVVPASGVSSAGGSHQVSGQARSGMSAPRSQSALSSVLSLIGTIVSAVSGGLLAGVTSAITGTAGFGSNLNEKHSKYK